MNEKVVCVGYVWGQRLRLTLVILSPLLFAFQLIAALSNPRGFGWLAAGLVAAVGIYVAYDYRRAKAAHESRPTQSRPTQGRPTKGRPSPGRKGDHDR